MRIKKLFRKPIVAIEIGNDWLKVLKNEPLPSGRWVTQASFKKLAEVNGPVSSVLAGLLKELRLSGSRVFTVLPRHLVTVRILEFPSMNPKEIRDMVELQVGRQTPYSREEIIASHKVLGSKREAYTKVMLVIARRALVSERLETLQKAGIEVEKVTLSSEGVHHWFSVVCPTDTVEESWAVGLVDVDSNYSDYMVVHGNQLVFTRHILIGANQLLGEDPNWQEKFIEELRNSAEHCQDEFKEVRIKKVFLTGAGMQLKNLETAASAKLDVPFQVLDPLRSIRIRKELAAALQSDAIRRVSACALMGVAMGYKKLEIDLTPNELKIEKMMEAKRRRLTLLGILLVSIFVSASLLPLVGIYNKQEYLRQLKQRIAKIETEANEVEKMRLQIQSVESRLDVKGAAINTINEIYQLTPREIYFSNINIEEKGQAILKGRACAMSDVFKFVTTLEGSPYFETVKTTYTATKKEKETEYVEFEIICSSQLEG